MTDILYKGTPIATVGGGGGPYAYPALGLEAELEVSPIYPHLFIVTNAAALASGTYDLVVGEPGHGPVTITGGGTFATLAAAAAALGWEDLGAKYVVGAGTVSGPGVVVVVDGAVDASDFSTV